MGGGRGFKGVNPFWDTLTEVPDRGEHKCSRTESAVEDVDHHGSIFALLLVRDIQPKVDNFFEYGDHQLLIYLVGVDPAKVVGKIPDKNFGVCKVG